jgi:hypothetical protein
MDRLNPNPTTSNVTQTITIAVTLDPATRRGGGAVAAGRSAIRETISPLPLPDPVDPLEPAIPILPDR